jgi:2-oxoisovalerate dehydrogenase E1 component
MSTPRHASGPGLAKAATRGFNRAEVIDRNFISFVKHWQGNRGHRAAPTISDDAFRELFESQLLSRHLDLEAREMRLRNEGFYTIGSSGHECNAVLGRLSRHTDPAFLHYRSGAFMMERARKVDGIDPVRDTALSLAASADDPISGGRHKVWGSVPLWVLPQTSTIASQLPKAVGTAVSLEQARRLGHATPFPADSVILCSFGDASANHSTATGALNAAAWTAYQRLPCPIVFICEDNGLGISVKSPGGWIGANYGNRVGLHYIGCDGLDLADSWRAADEALRLCREKRVPVFLHMKLRRLMGHAGTDVEIEYRPTHEVEADEAQDPLLRAAGYALQRGLFDSEELLALYEATRERVRSSSRDAATHPKLETAEQVMAPMAPYSPDAVAAEAARVVDAAARAEAFGGKGRLPEHAPPRHLALHINRALFDLMLKYPEMTLFGEDVAQKGGVYTVTSGLMQQFRGNRVFNTLLDEQTILGMAQGAAYCGLLPFPEIQYLAYFHNAADQIRGEAASMQFFSNGQFRNPMVVRIAALAYQKGFGGHFHNDNSFTALRDIPGLVIACPSRGDDAAMMLRTCAALAKVDGRVVAFLEPIALYMTKDLYEPKDGRWLFPYPSVEQAVPLGAPRVYDEGATDLLVVTFGNGVPMSLRAARRLAEETGKRARVLDLRWLKPLNTEAVVRHARETGRVLVVDEGRRTGGIAEELITALVESGPGPIVRRVTGEDSYIPLAAAANLMLVDEQRITEAARSLLAHQRPDDAS